jgi:hypothetical protein
MSTQTAGLAGSHDLRLSAWGPYTKRYIGVSHVPDVAAGLRFDLSVFPGLYRRSVVGIPNVAWESGYHPWEAAPDLSYFSHRHEILWKDQLYCDIAFCRLSEEAVLIRCACVNDTAERQSLALHYVASLHFPPRRTNDSEPIRPSRVELPAGAIWADGLAYEEVHYVRFDPRATLTWDGQIRGEIRQHGFVDGQGLGQGFGETAGDSVTYHLAVSYAMTDARLLLRYCLASGAALRLRLSGIVDGDVELAGTGDLSLTEVPVSSLGPGDTSLTLTSYGGAEIQIDGLALVPAASVDAIRFPLVTWNHAPERISGPRANTLILRYEHVEDVYGLAWSVEPFTVREFLCDDLDSTLRRMTHEHTYTTLRGPGEGHYTNVFMRPIFLEPHSERAFYGLVCIGDTRAVQQRLAAFDPFSPAWDATYTAARSRAVALAPSPAGETYRFSQERMAATVLTNVVYPVRTRGTWIRHYTPGRWWDSLYTWDSGFIGLGLLELDVDRAIDNLNAYVTEPGERDAAFIHHGSPVPTQFYLFLELWNRTQSLELLAYFYPRLRQYHRFLTGRYGSSTTRSLRSNLLRTWDYFYNSGGWDDYPPQVHVRQQSLQATVSPVINTAQAIRTAKIMRMAALALGEDAGEYDEDIAVLSHALQTHAWDEEAGYFSYVQHDAQGNPVGVLRHASGDNYNMGMDGACPLIADICTPEQERRLVGHLMSEERMWTRCGLTTVDQSAPYYRPDGYCNGSVWMPYQWFVWKTFLDMGQADEAHRIARTALDVWKKEVESSYNCYEHFVVHTGQGTGWHHFSGLSTPVLCWYSAYFRPGRLTTGLDAWVEALYVADDGKSLVAGLRFFGQAHRAPVVIAAVEAGESYTVTWEGRPAACHERYPGVLEVSFPAGASTGELVIRAEWPRHYAA